MLAWLAAGSWLLAAGWQMHRWLGVWMWMFVCVCVCTSVPGSSCSPAVGDDGKILPSRPLSMLSIWLICPPFASQPL